MTDFAKKGVANTGLVLGATALGLQVLGGAVPVLGCIGTGSTDLNNITISLWNASGTAKTYTTRMNLTIYGQITNTDFGFGQLFPKVEIK